jgi:hypothetical protein
MSVSKIFILVCVIILAAFLSVGIVVFLNPSLEIDKGVSVISSVPTNPGAVALYNRYLFFRAPLTGFTAHIDNTNLAGIIVSGNVIYIKSRWVTNSGEVNLIIRSGNNEITNTFEITIPVTDGNLDGYPDVVRLGEGRSFRDWFCAIAESQFYYPSDTWFDIHKDCAGLIEFAFKEALKKHDEEWARDYRFLSDFSIPDDRHYYYPDVPLLGRRVFRIREGAFDPENVERDFAVSAHGTLLRNYSMNKVGRDISLARKGDIIFFLNPDNLEMPSHSMIYTGPEYETPDPLEGFVIYHTGGDASSRGSMRKVKLADLVKHPNPNWRPLAQNSRFLGVYRWKILN